MKKLLFLFLFCALLGAKEIKIGVILPLSGIFKELGKEALNGINFAYMLEPSFENYEIKLVIKNSNSDKVDAIQAAKELIKEEAAALLGGIASGSAYEIANIANRYKTPFIVIGATNSKVTANKKYVTRICFNDPYQGKMIAKWALENNLSKAVLINFNNEDFSLEIAKNFKNFYLLHGGEILKSYELDSRKKTYTDILDDIKSYQANLFLLTGYAPEVVRVLKIIRKKKINATIVGTDALHNQEFLDLAKNLAEGVILVGYFNAQSVQNNKAKELLQEYKAKNHTDAKALTLLGIEAYNMLLEAIKRCIESDKGAQNPKCINDNLRDLKNFSTLTGIISIDKNGNAIKPIVFDIVTDGKFHYLQTIYPPKPKKEKK